MAARVNALPYSRASVEVVGLLLGFSNMVAFLSLRLRFGLFGVDALIISRTRNYA